MVGPRGSHEGAVRGGTVDAWTNRHWKLPTPTTMSRSGSLTDGCLSCLRSGSLALLAAVGNLQRMVPRIERQ